MSDPLYWIAGLIVLVFVVAPLAPVAVEWYRRYCEWAWAKIRGLGLDPHD